MAISVSGKTPHLSSIADLSEHEIMYDYSIISRVGEQ